MSHQHKKPILAFVVLAVIAAAVIGVQVRASAELSSFIAVGRISAHTSVSHRPVPVPATTRGAEDGVTRAAEARQHRVSRDSSRTTPAPSVPDRAAGPDHAPGPTTPPAPAASTPAGPRDDQGKTAQPSGPAEDTGLALPAVPVRPVRPVLGDLLPVRDVDREVRMHVRRPLAEDDVSDTIAGITRDALLDSRARRAAQRLLSSWRSEDHRAEAPDRFGRAQGAGTRFWDHGGRGLFHR